MSMDNAATRQATRTQLPLLDRPIRTTAIVAAVVAFPCGGAAIAFSPDNPIMLAGALGYASLLGGYSVGLALASSFRVTRWWSYSFVVPWICVGILWLCDTYWPGSVLSSRSLVFRGVLLFILVSWLLMGGVLAACGWWTYARQSRARSDAGLRRTSSI